MPSSGSATFEVWNRRVHYYLGLTVLLFLWLFLLTGLLLNHGRWALAQLANERRESRLERSIEPLHGETDLARAKDAMRQLQLTGEIDWPPGPQRSGLLSFNVNRPRDASQVQVDVKRNLAAIQHFENGRWAVFRIFHTFNGSRFNDRGSSRDWVLTTVWVLSMDAVAASLIVMVLGSYYMWYRLPNKRRPGLVALAAGFAACALFLARMV
jgi:hypothetical protein